MKKNKKLLFNETDPIFRTKELEEIIQWNYDADNWGSPGREHRQVITIACQLEYIKLTGKRFKPTYNCPA